MESNSDLSSSLSGNTCRYAKNVKFLFYTARFGILDNVQNIIIRAVRQDTYDSISNAGASYAWMQTISFEFVETDSLSIPEYSLKQTFIS